MTFRPRRAASASTKSSPQNTRSSNSPVRHATMRSAFDDIRRSLTKSPQMRGEGNVLCGDAVLYLGLFEARSTPCRH